MINGNNGPWVLMNLHFLVGIFFNWLILKPLHTCMSCQRTENLHKIQVPSMVWILLLGFFFFQWGANCKWTRVSKSWETCPPNVFQTSMFLWKVLDLLSSFLFQKHKAKLFTRSTYGIQSETVIQYFNQSI